MCDVCSVVRKHFPRDAQAYRMRCPACVHCGARLIQKMQSVFALSPPARREKSRAVLADWMAHGHSEADLRRLAQSGAWAVAPAGGG